MIPILEDLNSSIGSKHIVVGQAVAKLSKGLGPFIVKGPAV